MNLPKYDTSQTYEWNYQHAPEPAEFDIPSVAGDWSFVGFPVASPLGIPAGPLLNGKWCHYYASLGFDVLTYKTVRSREQASYALPNLQPVAANTLQHGGDVVQARDDMRGSWAVSFGMPSRSPAIWRADVQRTREQLPRNKVLVVSVVATKSPGWSLDDVANDYARCAVWAVESGADGVELNLSCPNVATSDGQLYQDPLHAGHVAKVVRAAVPHTPLIVKIGHVTERTAAALLLSELSGTVSALSMVNCIATRICSKTGEPLFGNSLRGIAGQAIREASIRQVTLFEEEVRRANATLEIIGVGGVSQAEHVRQYLAAGAKTIQLATAAMTDPSVAIRIRAQLAKDQMSI